VPGPPLPARFTRDAAGLRRHAIVQVQASMDDAANATRSENMTPSQYFRLLAAGVLAGSVAACAPALRGYTGGDIGLHVANYSLASVGLVVAVDGVRSDLGTVSRNDYRFFDLRHRGADPVASVLIQVEGGSGAPLRVDTLRVRRGSVIDLRLEAPLQRSVVRNY
jgi:hypothetical protein